MQTARKARPILNKHNEALLESWFPYRNERANYLMNVSRATRTIYMEVPKVACSTIKRTFQKIESEALGKPNIDDVHNKPDSPLISPLRTHDDIEEIYKESFVFSYVRNPFTRILSCYLDKIAGSQWERDIRLPQLGFDPKDAVSFVEFLLAVKKQNPVNMDIHWSPQTTLLSRERFHYDFIGRFENFSESFNKLVSFCTSRLETPREFEVINHNWHKTAAKAKLAEHYNDQVKALICEIYEEDFENFLYCKELAFI